MLLTHLCLFQFLGGASAVAVVATPVPALLCWVEPPRGLTWVEVTRPATWGG